MKMHGEQETSIVFDCMNSNIVCTYKMHCHGQLIATAICTSEADILYNDQLQQAGQLHIYAKQ